MKRNLIYFAAIFLVSQKAKAQANDSLKHLLNRWVIDPAYVEASAKAYIKEISKFNPASIGYIKLDDLIPLKEGESSEYNEDSTFILQAKRGKDYGTWSFAKEKMLITTASKANTRVEKRTILKISEKELWFKFDDNNIVKYIGVL